MEHALVASQPPPQALPVGHRLFLSWCLCVCSLGTPTAQHPWHYSTCWGLCCHLSSTRAQGTFHFACFCGAAAAHWGLCHLGGAALTHMHALTSCHDPASCIPRSPLHNPEHCCPDSSIVAASSAADKPESQQNWRDTWEVLLKEGVK